MANKTRAYDVIGNIAIVNFQRSVKKSGRRSAYPKALNSGAKKKFAEKILKENKSVKTVLEKKGKIHGRLRKLTTKYVAGEKTREVLYKENGCVFRFNIDTTYFSPRLSNERKDIASKIKKNETVLVMFAGVAPYPIVIAKNSQAKKVFSNEINREANKYAQLNIELNKLKDKVELVSGDVKKVSDKIKGNQYDVIVMPRPNLKDTFLKQAFSLSKKKTRIYYYGFCKVDDLDLTVEKIKQEAVQAKKKIKILNVKRAGETAPYKIRFRVDLVVL